MVALDSCYGKTEVIPPLSAPEYRIRNPQRELWVFVFINHSKLITTAKEKQLYLLDN